MPQPIHRSKAWLLPYVLREWRILIGVAGLTLAASAMTALQPWPQKILVDYALGSTPLPAAVNASFAALGVEPGPVALVLAAAIGSILIFLLYTGLDTGLGYAWCVVGQRMVYGLQADLFRRVQRLSPLFHGRHPLGDVLSRVTVDSWCVFSLSVGVMAPLHRSLTLVAVAAVAWRLDRQLTVIALVAAPLMALSSLYFGGRMKSRSRAAKDAHSKLLTFVHQTLEAIPVVQAFATGPAHGQRFQRLAGEAVAHSQRGAVVSSAFGLVNGAITTAGATLILYVGGMRVLSGALPAGTLLVFLGYLRSMQNVAEGLLKTYGKLKEVEASIDRVTEVMDEAEPESGVAALSAAAGRTVRLEGVTFGYEAGRAAIEQVTLEARPGEVVAVVGRTGAGKSTLLSLIPRFFDPWEGRVLIDGVDARDLPLPLLRSQIAIVFQEPYLQPMTVAENIALGRPGAPREEIEAAARAANADGFVRKLPEGYDSRLGERGATLSGGERQRLAIARAFLKNAPVLILDEPTAALDSETEQSVMDAIERLMEGRTTLVIAHRLSTIRRADRIVVMEQGRVIEQGTHLELTASGGSYSRLHSLSTGPGAIA